LSMITKRDFLFESGVYYGHRTSRLNPKMNPFIWGKRNGIHLINIALTEIQLSKAELFLEEIVESGKQILWVGTKKIVRDIVKKHAEKTKTPYLAERWLGGTLTNHNEVKKAVKNLAYNKEIYEKSFGFLTKKELSVIKKKIDRAQKCVGGIENLVWPIGAIIVADAKKDRIAIAEAISVGVPVISIVDTYSSPDGVTVCIPANDDLKKSVDIIFNYLSDAILRGAEKYKPKVDVAVLEEKFDSKEKRFKRKSVVIEKNPEVTSSNTKSELKDNNEAVESKLDSNVSNLSSPKLDRVDEKVLEKVKGVESADSAKSTKVKAAFKIKTEDKASSVRALANASASKKTVSKNKKIDSSDGNNIDSEKPSRAVKKKTSSVKVMTKSVVAKSASTTMKKVRKTVGSKKK
jgi:small subunit ribosomal protein S2